MLHPAWPVPSNTCNLVGSRSDKQRSTQQSGEISGVAEFSQREKIVLSQSHYNRWKEYGIPRLIMEGKIQAGSSIGQWQNSWLKYLWQRFGHTSNWLFWSVASRVTIAMRIAHSVWRKRKTFFWNWHPRRGGGSPGHFSQRNVPQDFSNLKRSPRKHWSTKAHLSFNIVNCSTTNNTSP